MQRNNVRFLPGTATHELYKNAINKGIPSLVPRSFPAQPYCKQGEAGQGPENKAELFPQHLWVRPLWFSALCLLSHVNLPRGKKVLHQRKKHDNFSIVSSCHYLDTTSDKIALSS